MNTHRTFPENLEDITELEKLMAEARDHVINEFGQFEVKSLLEKIDALDELIDVNYSLDSLHIFLSGTTTEIVKSSWPIFKNSVSVAENFVVKPLIKDFNRIEEYYILVLSKSDVRLLKATNDAISIEIIDDDFPFKANDWKQTDSQIDEFFNQIDKALLKIYNKTDMYIVVVSTENNWSRFMQVADKPSIYFGPVSNNHNGSPISTLGSEAWKIVVAIQDEHRALAIREMQDANREGKVITDLLEIFTAVKAGRGDLLITHDNYHQAVKMNGQYSFHTVEDVTLPGVIDDITSNLAWDVISKKGRAIFTDSEEFKSFGNIALKVRY